MRYDLEGIEKIAVIGAGLMGHGIAQCFAVKGYSVKLMDLQEEVLSSVLENIKGREFSKPWMKPQYMMMQYRRFFGY